jgi:hypothetical protein
MGKQKFRELYHQKIQEYQIIKNRNTVLWKTGTGIRRKTIVFIGRKKIERGAPQCQSNKSTDLQKKTRTQKDRQERLQAVPSSTTANKSVQCLATYQYINTEGEQKMFKLIGEVKTTTEETKSNEEINNACIAVFGMDLIEMYGTDFVPELIKKGWIACNNGKVSFWADEH